MSIAEKIGKYAYVPSHRAFFSTRGQYFARGAKTPQPGDIAIFQNESHIGIVEKVVGNLVYIIEGNTSSGSNTLTPNGGGVFIKTYYLSSSYLQGYGRPAYASGEASKLIAVAKNEVGYLEKASNSQLDSKTANAGKNNFTKYARDIWPTLQAQPWCDIFVSWCAIQADSKVSTGATTTEHVTKIFGAPKTWKNGSTDENVYADTALTIKIGSLNPYESCTCLGVSNTRFIVLYQVDGSSEYKIGFVEYSGGLSA